MKRCTSLFSSLSGNDFDRSFLFPEKSMPSVYCTVNKPRPNVQSVSDAGALLYARSHAALIFLYKGSYESMSQLITVTP